MRQIPNLPRLPSDNFLTPPNLDPPSSSTTTLNNHPQQTTTTATNKTPRLTPPA